MTPGEFSKIAVEISVSEVKTGDLFWISSTDNEVNLAVVTSVCRTSLYNEDRYTVNYVDLKSGRKYWSDFDLTDSLKGIPV